MHHIGIPGILVSCSLLLGAAACAADPTPGADAGPAADARPDAGPAADARPDAGPAFTEAPASVLVLERSNNAGSASSTAISGNFRTTALVIHHELARNESCRQLGFEPDILCEDVCEGRCIDGQCVPYPVQHSVGPLRLSGLRSEITLEPQSNNGYFYYHPGGPLLTQGHEVTASAPGDQLGGFELSVVPAAPLVVSNQGQLEPGTPLTIEWLPGDDPDARIRLWLQSTFRHLPSAVIECDVADTGSLTIPAEWVDWFLDDGHWLCGSRDCEGSQLVRYKSATTLVDGTTLELRAGSWVYLRLWP